MKLSIILLSLLFQALAFGYALRDYDQKPRDERHLARVIKKYDKDRLISNIRNFVKDTRPTRIIGSKGHHKSVNFVLDYINKRTNKKGELVVVDEFKPDIDKAIKLYQDDFSTYDSNLKIKDKTNDPQYIRFKNFTTSRVKHLNKLRQVKGRNIIWEKKGSVDPNKVIVIGAHYDTVAYDRKTLKVLPRVAQPGADNNASGVSISLSLIELLSEIDIKYSVRIVFFDFQEFGFLGSWDYAKKLKSEMDSGLKLSSYVNLLMLGHDSKIRDKNKRYGNMKLYYSIKGSKTHEAEAKVVKDLVKRSKLINSKVDFTPLARTFTNGDNISFQQQGIPSVTFTQNWESDFNGDKIHSSKDFVETLNLKTLYNSFLFIAQSIGSWALAF